MIVPEANFLIQQARSTHSSGLFFDPIGKRSIPIGHFSNLIGLLDRHRGDFSYSITPGSLSRGNCCNTRANRNSPVEK
jgi:hypothetical protein